MWLPDAYFAAQHDVAASQQALAAVEQTPSVQQAAWPKSQHGQSAHDVQLPHSGQPPSRQQHAAAADDDAVAGVLTSATLRPSTASTANNGM
jgi:hypothetical protein